jgi:hypothetical protein
MSLVRRGARLPTLPQTSDPTFQTDDVASSSGIEELAPTADSGPIEKSGPRARIRAGSAALKGSLSRLRSLSLSLPSASKDKDIDRHENTESVIPALSKPTWIISEEDVRCESPVGQFPCNGWCRDVEGGLTAIDERDEVKADVISLASCNSHEWDAGEVTMVSVGIHSVFYLTDLHLTMRRRLLISSGRIPTSH